MQYTRPPSQNILFDPVGSIDRGYRAGQNIINDIAAQTTRSRKEAARNSFSQAAGGDMEALKSVVMNDPQLGQVALQMNQYIEAQNTPKALSMTAHQFKVAATVALAAEKQPELWEKKARPLFTKLMGYDVGGVENVGAYKALFASAASKADWKLGEIGAGDGQMTKAIVNPDGTTKPVGQPYPKHKPTTGGGYKASDANSIRSGAAGIFGGRYDPATGQFTAINKDTELKIAKVAELAERIYMSSGGRIGHNQAIADAAKEFGLTLPMSGAANAKGNAAQTGNDPMNFRRWLINQ